MAAVAAAALACLFAVATASAKTEAECKQEYAAKKAAGEIAPKSRAAYLKACLAADPPPAAGAEASKGGGDLNKLREAAQNPVADLISVRAALRQSSRARPMARLDAPACSCLIRLSSSREIDRDGRFVLRRGT